jgi:uncharacterized protein (DUF1330 family)
LLHYFRQHALQGAQMAKGYRVTFRRSISKPAALAAYAEMAGPAIPAGAGRFLVRDTPARAYEAGINQGCLLIEFDSLEKAIATYESREDQAAVKLLEAAPSAIFGSSKKSDGSVEIPGYASSLKRVEARP